VRRRAVQQTNSKKEIPSQVRLVVEVDGNAVGVLNLDIDRLWPLINHRKRDIVPVEWLDAPKFDSLMRATIIKRLLSRLETHLYRALGDEIVMARSEKILVLAFHPELTADQRVHQFFVEEFIEERRGIPVAL